MGQYIYEYNIEKLSTNRILVMFRLDAPEEDLGCDISMEFAPLDEEDWFLNDFRCGTPNIPEINKMARDILEKLNSNIDISTFEELLAFCNKIGTRNSEIFSYKHHK